MPQLSPEGQAAINAISQRTGFSPDAVTSMLYSVIAGNGSMAQFNHPEFGGSGQWMAGGMTMVSDMFNSYLKGRVDGLCCELSSLVASQPGLTQSGSFQSQNQGGGYSGGGQWQTSGGGGFVGNMGGSFGGNLGGSQPSLFVPDASGSFNWWPADLGQPASTGAQNGVRYAYFPGTRRLAIDLNGQVTVYDSLDHQIGGFSQQQGGSGSLTFTSQYGTVFVSSLPIVSGAPQAPAYTPQAPAYAPQAPVYEPAPQPQSFAPQPQAYGTAQPLGQSEIISAIEKLADLHAKGILSDQEFSTKKAELLSRL